ncbi:MAG: GNAT family N-acetyltransferase, partial [Burkholderiales bacterium]
QLVAQDWPRSLALAVFRCETAEGMRASADAASGAGAGLGDEAEILAVARFHPATDRPGVAEFAIVVADDWQRKGLGHALFERIVRAARVAGVRELFGTTYADNRGMIDLARSYGFAVGPEPEEGALRRLTLSF